ncbi:hypothetical protein ACOMHN_038989 [Nucella lapillus]
MDSEVTIVVTRVHWQCSSCQVVNKHVVSIDQHLKSCHLDLISVATTSSPCPSPDLEMDDFSEDFTEGDLEFGKESDEKRSQGELPKMTPCSAADMSEENAQSGKNETTSSQSKSETRNLFSEDRTLYGRCGLIRHIRLKHASSPIYRFHCDICGKGVESKQNLQNHIAVHHDGVKRYGCEYCDQRFVCASTLKYHTLKEHTIEQQYKCEECGERFCDKVRLARHMYIHTGSARFMCELCGKGCHTTSEFKRHMTTHEEKRSFVCPQCGLEYKRRDHLTRHIRLKCCGSGEKAQADTENL